MPDATDMCCLAADVIFVCVTYLAAIVMVGLVAQQAFDYYFFVY